MNQDTNKRAIPIHNKNTGEVRMSKPVPLHSARQEEDVEHPETREALIQSMIPEGEAQIGESGALASNTPMAQKAETNLSLGSQDASNSPKVHSGDNSSELPVKKRSIKADEIQTFESFIEYAYGRKGKPLKLSPKLEKQIAQSARLDDAARSRLLQLAKGDLLLAVPRQLLLLSRDIEGFPALHSALKSFVLDVMCNHAVFRDSAVQATLRNLPDGLTPVSALGKVMTVTSLPGEDVEPIKVEDLAILQQNAAQLFVAWIACSRGFNAEQLSALLFQVVWLPAAQKLLGDNDRLRALTDISQAAGVGLACQKFQQRAVDAQALQAHAQSEAADLREKLAVTKAQLAQAEVQCDALQTELKLLHESTATEIDALRRQHAVEKMHLQHELEQLRGRLVKRLNDSVDMLEVGLSALRKDAPRVPVMVERAEHVVDALRTEIQELKEE